MAKMLFKIHGMDCAEEVDALRKTVGRLSDVSDLEFDLLSGIMVVMPASEALSEVSILEAVRKAGLEAVAVDTASFRGPDEEPSVWRQKGRLILCAVSGLLTAAGAASHAWLSGGVLHALAAGEQGERFPLVSIAFYLAAAITGAWYVLPKAAAAVRSLRADMNLLMTVAVAGAMAINQWFEAATVSFLFSLALLLESWSVGRARHAIRALLDITPRTARYFCPHEKQFEDIAVENVPVGATVLVLPGEKIPLDGVVSKGTTTANQAPITGESSPVSKRVGDVVFAGTINNEGAIEFATTKPATDTTLARIIHMIEEAQSRRAPSEQWVQKFARYYTPAMMVIALAIGVLPPLFVGDWPRWIYQALVVLVIACPCALVISTPVTIVAGLTSAARAGVLIKGGIYLELPACVKALAVDKTGTLTHGQSEVQRVAAYNGHDEREVLERAAALESRSEHPLARAVLRRAKERGVECAPPADFRSVQGKGAEGTILGQSFWIGSHRMMHEKGAETPEIHAMAESMEDAGHSVIAVGNDRHVCGLISIADGVREGARECVESLRRAGIGKIVVLTGDNEGTAMAVARVVGVDSVRAELLPEDKLRLVDELVAEFKCVAMVGDGVNDAPAMARATLGIAMGAAGSDAAIETADIALMSDDLSKLPWLVQHSRRALAVIRQNIGFALSVKVVFMALAAAGSATLWMAIAADMGASLLVIFNGLRLLDARVPPGR